jgi:hypothetical protein
MQNQPNYPAIADLTVGEPAQKFAYRTNLCRSQTIWNEL